MWSAVCHFLPNTRLAWPRKQSHVSVFLYGCKTSVCHIHNKQTLRCQFKEVSQLSEMSRQEIGGNCRCRHREKVSKYCVTVWLLNTPWARIYITHITVKEWYMTFVMKWTKSKTIWVKHNENNDKHLFERFFGDNKCLTPWDSVLPQLCAWLFIVHTTSPYRPATIEWRHC